MKTYALIDKNSGFYWGYATKEKPIQAVHEVNLQNHEYNEYKVVDYKDYDVSFIVYDCTDLDIDILKNGNGQDEEVIKAIEKCPFVNAYAQWHEGVDQEQAFIETTGHASNE